jgi:hypothetical protein
MTSLSNDEQLGTLLDAGVDDRQPLDDIIEQLSQTPSILLSDNIKHRFYTERFFPRLNQILQQWSKNQTPLQYKDSVTLRHASNLILQLSIPMSDQLRNNTTLLGTMKRCLTNISSCGYYVRTLNKSEDPNLDSFDCLIQAYGEAK